VAINLGDQSECDSFLCVIESEFATKRFTNAADAFDTVKAWIQEHASLRPGGDPSDHNQ
jgi:hypothetical protein